MYLLPCGYSVRPISQEYAILWGLTGLGHVYARKG